MAFSGFLGILDVNQPLSRPRTNEIEKNWLFFDYFWQIFTYILISLHICAIKKIYNWLFLTQLLYHFSRFMAIVLNVIHYVKSRPLFWPVSLLPLKTYCFFGPLLCFSRGFSFYFAPFVWLLGNHQLDLSKFSISRHKFKLDPQTFPDILKTNRKLFQENKVQKKNFRDTSWIFRCAKKWQFFIHATLALKVEKSTSRKYQKWRS